MHQILNNCGFSKLLVSYQCSFLYFGRKIHDHFGVELGFTTTSRVEHGGGGGGGQPGPVLLVPGPEPPWDGTTLGHSEM